MITLETILNSKREEIKSIKKINCKRNRKIFELSDYIIEKPFIAEVKKSSPSLGHINLNINHIEQAKKYEQFGAGCISVLTDKTFFSGDIEYLYEISRSVNLPILCKDFILSEIQILNAYISGADVVLIIVSILNDSELELLVNYSKNLGLNILYELHSYRDFERIKNLEPKYVGVNSRNFNNMKIEKDRALNLIKKLEGNFIKIAESGIETGKDIKLFKNAGADAFLIGTSLMLSNNLREKFKEFYSCL